LTRLYGQKHAPAAYRKEVEAMVRVLQNRYGLQRRGEAAGTTPASSHQDDGQAPVPQQVGFAW
jgi:hypothetical protein